MRGFKLIISFDGCVCNTYLKLHNIHPYVTSYISTMFKKSDRQRVREREREGERERNIAYIHILELLC